MAGPGSSPGRRCRWWMISKVRAGAPAVLSCYGVELLSLRACVLKIAIEFISIGMNNRVAGLPVKNTYNWIPRQVGYLGRQVSR